MSIKLPAYPCDVGWMFSLYFHARIGMLLWHLLLQSFADLLCESCNNVVWFNFYFIIVSSAENFNLRLFFGKESILVLRHFTGLISDLTIILVAKQCFWDAPQMFLGHALNVFGWWLMNHYRTYLMSKLKI